MGKNNNKIIQDVVNEELEDVKDVIRNLLAKKISFFEDRAKSDKQQIPVMASKKVDFGSYSNSLGLTLEDLALEIMTSPTVETVRQLRVVLKDLKSKFPSMTSSEVKTILDTLYGFIGYTAIKNTRENKPLKADSKLYNDITRGADKKQKEARRLIQDTLIKFIHENSIQYLQADLYPKSWKEAENEYVEKSDSLAAKLTDERTARNAKVKNRAAEATRQKQDVKLREEIANMEQRLGGRHKAFYAVLAYLKHKSIAKTSREVMNELINDPQIMSDALIEMSKNMANLSNYKTAGEATEKFFHKEGLEKITSEPLVQNLNAPLNSIMASDALEATRGRSLDSTVEKAYKIVDDPNKFTKEQIRKAILEVGGSLDARRMRTTLGLSSHDSINKAVLVAYLSSLL